MAEEAIYEARGVVVTTARFEVPGRAFAMASVASVRTQSTSSSVIATITILIGGAIAFVSGGEVGVLIVGGVFALVGVAMAFLSRRTMLYVTTPGGEVKALTHADRQFVEGVADAVKQAIVRRG